MDIYGKRNKTRSVPVVGETFELVEKWLGLAGISEGYIFRGFYKNHRVRRTGITPQAIRDIVHKYSLQMPRVDFAPHDLRRTYAHLAYKGGAPLKQIQISLGHASIKTTEIYLGIEQDFVDAPADYLDIDW